MAVKLNAPIIWEYYSYRQHRKWYSALFSEI